jgi:CRP-like cAMP-binding protein
MQAPALLATVFTLFARRSAHPTLASKLTPVEHVHALLNCPYLATAQLTHHEFLGEQLEFVRPPDGTVICRRGEPLQGVWLIRAGTVLGAQGLTLQPGAVVGAEALQGSLVAQETLTAAPHFTALFLPAAAIRRCIETFPELGISLLAQAPEA